MVYNVIIKYPIQAVIQEGNSSPSNYYVSSVEVEF